MGFSNCLTSFKHTKRKLRKELLAQLLPIENLWYHLDKRIAKCRAQIFSLDQLEAVIHEEWVQIRALSIVCSTRQTETLLVNVLNFYSFQFMPLSRCFETEPPVVGALVRFRKSSTSDRAPNFKLSVDYVVAYDVACMIDRQFIAHFKSVHYYKPYVVSLACERTPDLRICNYRDKNNNEVVNGTTSLQEPDFPLMAMFCNIKYPKHKVVDRQKANEDMSNDLVAWVISKENKDFYPTHPEYLLQSSAGGYKGPSYDFHDISEESIAELRSKIQTSFSPEDLMLSSLTLPEPFLKGVDWHTFN